MAYQHDPSVTDPAAVAALATGKKAIANDLSTLKKLTESGRNFFLTGLCTELCGDVGEDYREWVRDELGLWL